jgi:ABC-type uncharacterized transport system ATPase subunit
MARPDLLLLDEPSQGLGPRIVEIDVVRDMVEVNREPEASAAAVHGWHYGTVETLRPPASVRALIARDVAIAVADLLP